MSIDYTKKSAQIVKATKKLVDDLISLNTQNRNVRKAHLKWIVRAIEKQDFHLTTQAISAAGSLPRVSTLTAFLHYSMSHDHDKMIELASQVNTGENLKKSMPAYKLRQYILETGKMGRHGGAAQFDEYKIAVACCLAHSRDEEMSVIRRATSWEGIKRTPESYTKVIMFADKNGVLMDKKKKFVA